MQKKLITVEGIKLAYLEINHQAGNIIFFIHGNSTSANTWNSQLVSRNLSSYRLIAFDLPAHGESESLSGTLLNYSLPDIGKIMATALKQLANNNPYLLAGVSLGTNIISEMLAYDLQPLGIVLIGSCVLGGNFTMDKIFKADADLHAGFSDHVPEIELKDYAKLAFSSLAEKDWLEFKESYYRVKDNFRSEMFGTVTAGDLSNEISLLCEQAVPVLVVFGENEKVCEIDYLDNAGLSLWKEQSFKIEKAGHFVNTDQPDILNQLISDFAEDIFK